MDTTKLIVEYLVAGSLMIAALLLAATSWFPSEMNTFITASAQQQAILSNEFILVALFFALAYAVGIVSEYAGERTFEWLLNRTKRERMVEYVESYSTILTHSPIFSSFVQQSTVKREAGNLPDCIGQMRFFVMSRSAPLYADIAAQINRFRVIRALFLVEVIVLVAIIGQLRHGVTMFWFFTFVLVACVAIVNFMAVRSRFGRYCRAVERSYIVLMYDQAEAQHTSTKQPGEA